MSLQQFSQTVILCFLNLGPSTVSGEVVGFVEDNQIPRRGFLQSFDPGPHLQRVNTCDQEVVLGEGIRFAVGNISFASENLEI